MIRNKILVIIVLCLISFFLGRITTKPKETVKYVKGETITNTVKVPDVKYIEVPKIYYLPTKPVTITKDSIVVQVVDTSKIIEEYITKNQYIFNVFDDEKGKLDVNQTIQYNKLQNFDYTFTPIQKEITIKRERIVSPFASVSYNSFGTVGAGGGLFYHNIGVEVQYLYSTYEKRSGLSGGLKIKF